MIATERIDHQHAEDQQSTLCADHQFQGEGNPLSTWRGMTVNISQSTYVGNCLSLNFQRTVQLHYFHAKHGVTSSYLKCLKAASARLMVRSTFRLLKEYSLLMIFKKVMKLDPSMIPIL